MRIMLYTYAPVLGGMLQHVIALASRLRERGHEMIVVGNRLPEVAENLSQLNRLGIHFYSLAVEGKFDFKGLQRFKALLKREKPDVVHFHLGNTFESLPPILLTLAMKYPVVMTEHYLPFPLGRQRLLPLVAKRLAAKRARKIILLGEAFASPYRELTRVDRGKISIIPPFSEVMTGHDTIGNRQVIGFSGRFSVAKGVETLMRLAPALIVSGYKIIFCGRGELEGEVDRLAAAYPGKIEKRFYVQGMERFYRDIGILLFLSQSEGLPLAVVEAISAGVPVISTKVGVLEEYFREGEGVLYLPAGETGLVFSALMKLADMGFRDRVVGRGKEVFSQRLDPAKISLQIEGLYREFSMK